MQTKDHLALGHFLLDISDCKELHKYRRAFLMGCVEPDYNMASYARGMKGHRKFRGHNAGNSLAHIEKCLSGIQTNGLQSAWDFFKLGNMLHYAADAFTWPHNEFWRKSLVQHAVYEAKLHERFTQALNTGSERIESLYSASLQQYFESAHDDYRNARHDMKTDCQYIIRVCKTMLAGCLCYAEAPAEEAVILKEVDLYEGAYHHGLVSTGR
ncbi:MAG: zinc dependent phospholipase C family protein [Petrimonas sp.]|nr:zinc dependent phospholipase C family protein [Petrimonas sp.]